MLGVFCMDVKKLGPTAPKLPDLGLLPVFLGDQLEYHIVHRYERAAVVNLGDYGYMAYKGEPLPRVIYRAKDGIFCISEGCIKRKGDEIVDSDGYRMDDLIADYEDVQVISKNRPLNLTQLAKAKQRNYNCILFDNSVNVDSTSRTALAVSCLEDKPLYWGLDIEGNCIVSDVLSIIESVCGIKPTSYKVIGKGHGMLIPDSCFSSAKGESSLKEAAASSSGVCSSRNYS